MSVQQEDNFRQRFAAVFARFIPGKIVGAGGLAILCALALLPFWQSGQPEAVVLTLLSGLGLDVLAGVAQRLYQEIWTLPDKSEQERFELVTKAIQERLSKDATFPTEVSTFLKAKDAIKLAEEIAKGNRAVHGWLLTAIREDITKYGLELARLYEEQKEQTTLLKELSGNPKIGIVYSDDDFQDFVPLVESTARSCLGRNSVIVDIKQIIARVRNSSATILKRNIKDETRNCDVVVFIYSLYSYDSLSSVYLEAALDCFKQNFFFIADTDFSSLLKPAPHNEQVARQEEFLKRIEECAVTVFRFADGNDFQSKLSDQFEKISNAPWYGLSQSIVQKRWADWAKAQMDEIRAKELDDRPVLESPLWPFWEEFCSYSWLEGIQAAVNNLQLAAQALAERKATLSSALALENIPENLFEKNWIQIPGQLVEWCTDKTNNEIEKAIRELIKRKKKRRKKSKSENKQPDSEVSQIQSELQAWQDAFRKLRSLLDHPKFGRCFLVIGRSGAGKTHFVATLLNKQKSTSKAEYCCICLEDDELIRSNKAYSEWRSDFENLLLQRAQLKLDHKQEIIEWKSLEAMDSFLRDQGSEQPRPVKLAIVIDEFSEWIKAAPQTFLVNLKRFIDRHTHLQSLVWVFTIKETDYLYIANEEVFFRKYIMPALPSEVSIQGWLDLDKLNVRGFSRQGGIWQESSEQYLSLKRIFDHEGLEAEEILVKIFQNPNGSSMKLLEIPFISWLAADWLNKPDSKMLTALPDLRYIDFIERFSSNRQDKIMHSGRLQTGEGISLLDELDEVFKFLTEKLLEGIDTHNINSLTDAITEKFEDADLNLRDGDITKCLIDLLTEYRLLERKKAARKLDSVLIWEYRAAREIKKYLWSPRIVTGLPELFGENGRIRNYLGVFEFLLLLVERDFLLDSLCEVDRESIHGIINFAFSDTPHLRSRLWAAVSKTSGSFQHSLIDWLKDQALQFDDKVEFFNYISFLRYAAIADQANPNAGVPWDLRIKLLSTEFESLEKWDLGSYFAKYILNPLCELVSDGEKIALSMAYLRGIEDYYSRPAEIISEMTGVPYVDERPYKRNEWMRLGKWSFDALNKLLVSDNSCDQLYQWSMAMVNAVSKKTKNESTSVKERDRIWACCARYMLDFMVREKHENVFQWLADLSWPVWEEPSSEFQKEVFSALEEYLTLEVGKSWRISGEDDREKYLAVFWDFAKSSNSRHQKTVFYAMLHTVESPRHDRDDGSIIMTGPYPKIDSKLWSILEYLKEHSSSETEELFESTFYHNQREHYSPGKDEAYELV